MKKKLLLWFFVLVLLSSFAYASLTDDLYLYYAFDDSANDNSTNARNGNLNSGSYSATSILGKSVQLTSQANFFTLNTTTFPKTGSNSFCGWLYPTATNVYWDYSNNAGTNSVSLTINSGVSADKVGLYDGTWRNWNYVIPTNSWNHVCWVTYGGTDIELFINGTSKGNITYTGTLDITGDGTEDGHTISTNNLGHYLGYTDEMGYWNRSLTSTEINQLYNNGTGLAYPLSVGGGGTNFTVYAFNASNNQSLTIFNATINGTFYETSNGSIITPILNTTGYLVNITVRALGFNDNETINWNVSTNYNASMEETPSRVQPGAEFFNGTRFYFNPNASYYDWSTETLTQHNISAENQTIMGGLINITLNETNYNVWMNITYNYSNSNVHPVYCGNTSDRSDAFQIEGKTELFNGTNTSQTWRCWCDYINATQGFGFFYEINATVI